MFYHELRSVDEEVGLLIDTPSSSSSSHARKNLYTDDSEPDGNESGPQASSGTLDDPVSYRNSARRMSLGALISLAIVVTGTIYTSKVLDNEKDTLVVEPNIVSSFTHLGVQNRKPVFLNKITHRKSELNLDKGGLEYLGRQRLDCRPTNGPMAGFKLYNNEYRGSKMVGFDFSW